MIGAARVQQSTSLHHIIRILSSLTVHTYDSCGHAKTTHKAIWNERGVLPQVRITLLHTKIDAFEAFGDFADWAERQHSAHQALPFRS